MGWHNYLQLASGVGELGMEVYHIQTRVVGCGTSGVVVEVARELEVELVGQGPYGVRDDGELLSNV